MDPGADDPKAHAGLAAALLAAVPDFVAHVDASGLVVYANRGYTPAGVLVTPGCSWIELMNSEQRERAAVALGSVIATRAPVAFESRADGIDGGIAIYSTRIAPVIVDDLVTGAIAITRDITGEKHVEAQVLYAERTTSFGSLAAGVAHEINNPLAVVIANLQLALRRVERVGDDLVIPEVALDELRDAFECADQVKEIVADLEVFSRTEGEPLGPVDVHRVIEATLRAAWSEVRHRAQIVRAFGTVPMVIGNPARLGQLLLNLIVNAAQAIEEGHYAGNAIRIATSVDDRGQVAIAIRDTGIGIAPPLHHRIFAPFFTTKAEGVGLGLTLSRRIVASLGGSIDFTSELGSGSEFTVRLPMAPARPAPSVPVAPSVPSVPLRGRVLVVDDDPTVVRTLVRILGGHHEVVTANSGEAAVALIHGGARFDVILCDLMMPQLTGMDVMTALEASAPDQAARVVFVTGGAFTQRARAFLESDRYRRLDKPFSPQTVLAKVDEVMRALGDSGTIVE